MDEYQIVELVKDRYRTGSLEAHDYFLLNDRTIIWDGSYKYLRLRNPSISKQVIGYVNRHKTEYVSILEFPTLIDADFISFVYLHKKGYVIRLYSMFGPGLLPNLQYIIYCITNISGIIGSTGYEFQDRLVIELVDLDVVANNLNLPKIMSSVLGPKLLSENNIIEPDEVDKIEKQMRNQKLFAGHTWDDAMRIVFRYFDKNERDLSKEVFKISVAYQQVFRPYRVVYNAKTWQPVLL